MQYKHARGLQALGDDVPPSRVGSLWNRASKAAPGHARLGGNIPEFAGGSAIAALVCGIIVWVNRNGIVNRLTPRLCFAIPTDRRAQPFLSA